MELTHFSLFSGIGGIDLAAEWAGFTTVGQCEWADYPTKVLEKHWPDVPRWRDIRSVTLQSFTERTNRRTVDLISGGFPCQPFSVAGKRKGKDDDRYLWPEMLRVISEFRPTWVLGENVAGIVNMAIDQVLSDLEAIGYETQAYLIPACGVDAPHRRYRVFIVAYSNGNGCARKPFNAVAERRNAYEIDPSFSKSGDVAYSTGKRCGEAREHSERSTERVASGGVVAYTDNAGLQGRERGELQECTSKRVIRESGTHVAYDDHERLQTGVSFRNKGEQGAESQNDGSPVTGTCNRRTSNWWLPEPNVGRVANGVPYRVDRLKCLGNAVVPQQVYPILKAIADIERGIDA